MFGESIPLSLETQALALPAPLLFLAVKKVVKVVRSIFLQAKRTWLMKATVMTRLLAKEFSIRMATSCSKATPEPTTNINARVPKMATGVRIKKSKKRRRFSNLKEELSLGKSISLNISREDLKKEAIVMVEAEVKLMVKSKVFLMM